MGELVIIQVQLPIQCHWVNMALPRTSASVIHALHNLSKQTNKYEREALLNAGLKEILKWFGKLNSLSFQQATLGYFSFYLN